jgi:hypothetical protein
MRAGILYRLKTLIGASVILFLQCQGPSMQQMVLLHTRRSLSIFSNCGGLVARFDKTQFAAEPGLLPKGSLQREGGGWLRRIARAIRRAVRAQTQLRLTPRLGPYQLSKGSLQRVYLAEGGRISCRTGRIWITLNQGGRDIVLTDCESESFGLRASVLVEALTESRISLELSENGCWGQFVGEVEGCLLAGQCSFMRDSAPGRLSASATQERTNRRSVSLIEAYRSAD